MLSDLLGPLLRRGARVLRTDVRPHLANDEAAAELEAVTALIGELGVMLDVYPSLVAAQNDLYASALEDVGAAMPDHPADPVDWQRLLLSAVETAMESASTRGDRATLARLREGLRAGAVLEQKLISDVRTSAPGGVRI